MITYEFPLNERIRTLLRLEDLYGRMLHFARCDGAEEHHVALLTLFEILEVAGRADLKVDILQELERQRQFLISFRNNPDISEEALSGALYEIEQASSALLAMTGKIGHYLRENDWLMSVKSRAAIPGGVCQFDIPSYHFWLNHDPAVRRDAMEGWYRPLLPIRDGIAILMRLLRANGREESQEAKKGAFQLMLSGRTAQLVRLRIKPGEPAVPEVSANKYALNVRFTTCEGDQRPRQHDGDVAFMLTLCNL